MSPAIATVIYVSIILGLFWLDRNQRARTSWALWVPVIWISIACSRSVAQWLDTPGFDTPDQVLDGNPIDRLVYAVLLAIGLAILISRRKQLGRFVRGNEPMLFFLFFCLASLLWSDFPDVAFKRWTKAVGDFVMVFIVLSDRDPLAAIQRLLARTSYILIPLSLLFIKYYPDLGRQYGYWLGDVYYVGVTTNKNTLGAICLCFGLGALWRLLSAYQDRELPGRFKKMLAQCIILAMVFWLLRHASSMTSLSCFLMGSVMLLATNWRAIIRRPSMVHFLTIAMLLISISVLFLGASPEVLKFMGKNPTLTDRTQVWAMLLGLDKNPWIGTGFESFWLGPRLTAMWNRYWWHPNEAHNGYLEVYLNLGWAGVTMLLVVIATGYRTVFRAWRHNIPTGSLCLAYFCAGVAFNFTEAAFFKMLAPAWLFFLLAIVRVPEVSYGKIYSPVKKPVRRRSVVAWEHRQPELNEETV
jgi:hypothetical protein